MTKTFTLLLLFVANSFLLFSKNSIQIVEISPGALNNPAAKINTTAFRFDHTDYMVVQPRNNSAAYLAEQGLDVQSYLGDGYYLIASDADKTASLLQTLSVQKVGYLAEDSKIEESLTELSSAIPVTVLYASSLSDAALSEMAQQTGINIIYHDKKHHHFSSYANAQQMQKLAKYPFVYFITRFYERKNPLMYDGMLMLGVNQLQEPQPFGFNLKGEGVNVGVWDEGAFGPHIDLPVNRNFVIDKENSSLPLMAHPTEVGGCIGGSGNLYAPFKGIAPRTNLYYWDVLGDIVAEIEEGKNKYAVDISNHSYNFASTNCFQSGLYIPEAADLDRLVHDNPTLLPVVAVGNTAAANCAIASDTFSSVDIGLQGCKNALTVGWLYLNEKIVENSGRGPTADGRLKPELVAKGFSVTALTPNNGVGVVYGSSYAAPQIAGVATLLYQKYKQQFSALPDASLIKAIMLNTARDLGNPGPDYTYGFGKPDAYRAANTLANNLYAEGTVNQGTVKTHSFNVPPDASVLKVTLSWTDKEGSPVAAQAIVNNLDIKLVTPAGDTVLPWKLNPANPKGPAFRGIDDINTNEQITMDKPAAGIYTIVVKGTQVPFGPQDYAVAYYAQERKIELTHPNGGELLDPGNVAIKWYANGVDSLAKIEFSSDNGASWQTVINNQQLSAQNYTWGLPDIVSNQCLMKITSGNNIAISASTFSVGTQIFYPSINHTVCDRTVKINWPAVGGATGYKVYLFVDTAWVLVGQTNLLTYTINNLINGKAYMYSISTIKNGMEGNHSLANSFTPAANTCTTLNDVGVYAMFRPLGGRKFTSSTLSNAEKMSFIIKNFGTATQNSIPVSYKVNGGPIRTATLTDVVTANDTSIMNFTVNIEDMSAVGNYNITAWTTLPGDNNTQNDTLSYTVRHLPNAPLVLPFSESFESVNTQLSNNTFGIKGLDYADYYPENGGRLRSNEGNLYANSGSRSITLDNYIGTVARKNELIFTYNLSNYVDSVLLLDFTYLNRSEPDSNDLVFVRGDDAKPWVRLYDLFANRGNAGTYKKVTEVNLYQKLKIENGQNFSSSTQLKIQQTGVNAATTPYASGGYSFDDFKLYNAGRDVAVTNAKIKKVHCAKSFAAQPLTITVKNNSALPISNLPVSYKAGNDPVVTELIPSTIAPGDTLSYVFSTMFDDNAPGYYTLQAWAENAGDRNRQNDTFETSVIVMQTIDSFPYYNDFETNNGNVFSEGVNNSWVWGTPLKYNMNNAAQDSKAWTTGIEKGYNFNEDSYLYMGCMDFSALNEDPLVSFNFISVMQTKSDSAYAEYSTNGTDWQRLGCYNCGLNWYNGFQSKPYWDRVTYPWQVAHLMIPLAGLADPSNFMYRIHFMSDDFVISEGLGIDDLRIFNDFEEIATTDSGYVSQTSLGNGWIQFHRNGRLVAELHDDNKSLGNVLLGYEANQDKLKVLNDKNIFPRNWVIKPQNNVAGNYMVRLYILNNEYTNYILNEDSINRMGDMNLLRYIGLNTNLDIIDNHVKSYYRYFTPQEIQFYPFENGYFVEFTTDTLGEFYLLSTKQDADAIQNINLLDFSAQILNDDVLLTWKTTREVNSKEFVIQYSFDAATFIDVDTVPAGGFSSNTTLYDFLHELNASSGVYYYRIKMVDNTNKFTYSLIDSVYFAPSVGVKQNPFAATAYISGNDIMVEFKNKVQTPSTILVYNTSGQLQFTKKLILQNGKNPLGIPDFAAWSKGAYYLQIQSGERSYYSKLMKL